jgi:RND family efflux transporter MFP subunit
MKASTRFVWMSLLTLASCGSKPRPIERVPLQAVRVQEVRSGPVVEGRSYLAEVVPAQTVRILAQVPGTVAELGADEGAELTQGALIARIVAADVAARRARVRAERRRAELERDFACAQLETDRVLAKAGDLPRVQLERSEKACASGRLAVEAALAVEREASVAGTRATETAPFDGQVLTYLVDVGQTVMPGTPLARYGSREHRLRLRVVANDLQDISVGTRVVTPAGDGRVVEIGAQALGPGRLYDVSVSLADAGGLHMGETLSVTLVTDERPDATAVPESALGVDEDGTYVLVEEDARLRRVDVTVGPRERGWVAIEPALPPGTHVVTTPLSGLDLGRPVLAVAP